MSDKLAKRPEGGHESPFTRIRRLSAAGNESWSSREFAQVLGYTDYRNFEQVVEKARLACFSSGNRVDDHFVEITEMSEMGATELAANLFRATQTEEKLRREKVLGKDRANRTHHEVGAKVRKTIRELGGTMPEDLPIAEDIKKLESKRRKALQADKEK